MVVMVVEDSPTMRALICAALRRIEGIVLIEGTDGADALAKLEDVRPDLLLTDLNMPNVDGFTLIERVRASAAWKDIPIAVLSTEGAAEDQARARALGVATYVTKPIRPNVVVETVLKLLNR